MGLRLSVASGLLSDLASGFITFQHVNLHEPEVTSTVEFRLSDLQSRLAALVKDLCAPLFSVFDFAEISDEIYQQIVTDFVNGKAT
ncbi:MAG: hypothetical protein ABI693_00310 [Bryobacteraceae bacterium]